MPRQKDDFFSFEHASEQAPDVRAIKTRIGIQIGVCVMTRRPCGLQQPCVFPNGDPITIQRPNIKE